MTAEVIEVAGRMVELSATGKSGIRTNVRCIGQGSERPKIGWAGILEISGDGRRVRFISNHKFFDFLYPRAEGTHRYLGATTGSIDDAFQHVELGTVRFSAPAEAMRVPPSGAMGELIETSSAEFEFRLVGERPYLFRNV